MLVHGYIVYINHLLKAHLLGTKPVVHERYLLAITGCSFFVPSLGNFLPTSFWLSYNARDLL